ncbi:MAG: hypothetical protein KGY80_14455 [Candidatus Thorarchaeota archaeon]|nr:hypothetical protein [Candidatus Thorarchaeota archaeon]
MKCRNAHVAAVTLILFVALLGISVAQLSTHQDPAWFEHLREDQSDFILSESKPTFTSEYSAMRITQIEITSITTNDTPVALMVTNETSIIVSLDNITGLGHLDINIIPVPPETINVTVSRKSKTASVRLEILIHELIPNPIAPRVRLHPMIPIASIVAVFGIGYYLIEVRKDCWDPVLEKEESVDNLNRIAPLGLVILTLVSSILVSPALSGIMSNRYATEEVESVVDRITVSGELNESSPQTIYQFHDVADSYEATILDIRLHSLEFGSEQIKLEGEFDTQSNELVIDVAESSPELWIEPRFQYDPSVLYLRRIDSDVEFSFVMDIIGKEEVFKNDPTVPIILAISGLIILGCTIYRAWVIDRTLKRAAES